MRSRVAHGPAARACRPPCGALGQGMDHEPSDDEIKDVLTRARRVAVVGASSNTERPSHGIFAKLLVKGGYDVVPVNPNERAVMGVPAVATLAEAGKVDVVVVFRRSEHAAAIAREAVAAGAGALWLQVGVISAEAEKIARDAGLFFVMDHCIGVAHSRLRVPKRPES
jgi:uncharacterized protein